MSAGDLLETVEVLGPFRRLLECHAMRVVSCLLRVLADNSKVRGYAEEGRVLQVARAVEVVSQLLHGLELRILQCRTEELLLLPKIL